MKLKKNKVCIKCKKVLSLDSFCKNKRYKDGLHTYCRSCNSANTKRWGLRNKKKQKEIYRRHGAKLKRQVIDAYGGECACCGISTIEFLTIDHINKNGKEHRKRFPEGWGVYRDLIRRNFPNEGYRVLCMNCNFATRYINTCPHELY